MNTTEPRPLGGFSPPVRAWFQDRFAAPTPPQQQGWPAIAAGDDTLILAPTGSGKTLSAFLWGIDRLIVDPTDPDDPHTRIVYVSPLRALAVDVDKNLRGPLAAITKTAAAMGIDTARPTVGVRTGDTTAQQRRQIARRPPDILITTPESLYLMMTSQARAGLTRVQAIIVDEIHAMVGTKRGAHLALTLERLADRCKTRPQRIGLSATQRPLEETARFLAGHDGTRWRPVTTVDAGVTKQLDLEIVVPIDDMGDLSTAATDPRRAGTGVAAGHRSIWPSIHPRLLELIQAHTSTLVFVNNRRLAERLATRLNELADPDGVEPTPLVKAHHGSIARDQRLVIEDELKSGTLRGLVATSSLELGIDMGSIDLVVQIESPGAVSRGLQRVGRAGHNVGDVSRAKLFPKHRADLLEAAVVAHRMRQGLIESTFYPRNPLDVLAQQIVAMCALDDWPVDRLARLVRGAANFAELTDDVLHGLLDLLAGRYPSERFSELRPRIVWDRVGAELRGRRGAQRLAVTNPGTIPDRGLFGVFLPDGTRVGELDEEMVYESRPGDVFLLGASSWRIDEITFDRVVVHPAPGQPGRMPFWRGAGPGRPLELGEAIGEFVRDLEALAAQGGSGADDWLIDEVGLDPLAAKNLLDFIDDQAAATGAVPTDNTIVVERFLDEIGDWRVCVHTPFGAQVHAPWAMAIRSRLADELGADVEMLWSDDGIVMRLPEHVEGLPTELIGFDPAEIDRRVIDELPRTALFASRFREAAGRALLLPRRRPGHRTPLWQQRQRAADLLHAARDHDDFPIVLETIRECIHDVFDLPALRRVLGGIAAGSVRVVTAETERASPYAQSLLFAWIATYMYEGDAPQAERRAAALTLDRELLSELLGEAELRELLDPAVVARVEADLQRLTDGRAAREPDELHDMLRELGPLTSTEVGLRSTEPDEVSAWIDALLADRRAFVTEVAGESRLVAAEDAAVARDGLGAAVSTDLDPRLLVPAAEPLARLVERYARTHGPFLTGEVAARLGVEIDLVLDELVGLEAAGRVVRGEFRPEGSGREWCDRDVLRRLRRGSLAALRRQVEPVPGQALARFLPRWQGVGAGHRGIAGLVEVLGTLQGASIPASILESDVLAVRMAEFRRRDLDSLCTSGDLIWIGAGSGAGNDGRVRLLFRDQAALLASPAADPVDGPHHDAIRARLGDAGASFWPELALACADAGLDYDDETVLQALWDLVWNGEVTNDSLAPLRARLDSKATGSVRAARAGADPRLANRVPRRPGRARPRVGQLNAGGPPSASGRWSLVSTLLEPRPEPTRAAHAQALQLLERYGVLTREATLAEGHDGGFAAAYPMLRELEDRGEVRRGYFVAGLGAAQFALAGAVDRLRRAPRQRAIHVLAAADPAQPFGASLPWPTSAGRPSRRPGALVVIDDGTPVVYVERGGKSVLALDPAAADDDRWAAALAEAAAADRARFEITTIDGEPARDSPLVARLETAGFRRGYRGLSP